MPDEEMPESLQKPEKSQTLQASRAGELNPSG